MSEYQKLAESFVIISIGLTMHLNCISVIELHHSKVPLLKPSLASSIFVFSTLCTLAKVRAHWPNALRKPQKIFMYLIELALILYATDFVLRQVWLPSLKLMNFACHHIGQALDIDWIRNEAFFFARILLAIVAFISMIDVTGTNAFLYANLKAFLAQQNISCRFKKRFFNDEDENENEVFIDNDEEVVPEEVMPIEVEPQEFEEQEGAPIKKLTTVPQENILNLAHKAGTARRRRNPRKPKRFIKLVLNDPNAECSC